MNGTEGGKASVANVDGGNEGEQRNEGAERRGRVNTERLKEIGSKLKVFCPLT